MMLVSNSTWTQFYWSAALATLHDRYGTHSSPGESMNRTIVLALACGLAFDAASAQTPADGYPQRTVTFLCPFPAGGGTDILTRLLAHELQDKLKRPVVVDNRPGGGTIVAAQASARAAPSTAKSAAASVAADPARGSESATWPRHSGRASWKRESGARFTRRVL